MWVILTCTFNCLKQTGTKKYKMIKGIIKTIIALLEIAVILIIIFYPWLVKAQNPLTFYWIHIKELWVSFNQPHLLNRLFGNLSVIFK